jgi:xanthine dehydrogenase accessory factor
MRFRIYVQHDERIPDTTVNEWISALQTLRDRRMACALVVLIQAKGSTPREAGATMVVTSSESFGSIGGGALEYGAIEEARRMLRNGGDQKPLRRLQTWHLGADAGQCCGGECTLSLETIPPRNQSWLEELIRHRDRDPCVLVTSLDGHDLGEGHGKLVFAENHVEGSWPDDQEVIAPHACTLLKSPLQTTPNLQIVFRKPGDKFPTYLLQRYDPNNFPLMLFGAGHVGKAIIQVMSGLPCHVTWVDARPDMFPASVPLNVKKMVSARNDRIIAQAQPGTFFLIMTHSHPLDLELCGHVLQRGDFGYLGLIGSKTKRERFEKRLRQMGLDQKVITRLTCPIGIPEISDKSPGAIAVAVAAQILRQRSIMEPMTGATGTNATLESF